jgi:hypothetical protein
MDLTKLNVGDVAITRVRKVSNGKIEVEFAEKMQREANNSTLNVLSLLNAGDPAFEQKARRAWVIGTADNVAKLFNLDEAKLVALKYDEVTNKGESLEVFIKNPSIEVSGIKYNYRVVIEETTTPTDFQLANVQTSAKKRGKDGDFITSNGKYIFSNTVVRGIREGEATPHILLPADVVVGNPTAQTAQSANALNLTL